MEKKDKIKILVVDDEESLCEILQFNLQAEGYDVDVAYSAEQALKMELDSYSLLLLDIMMGHYQRYEDGADDEAEPEARPYPHHLHHRQRCGRRYGVRTQPRCRRLYRQAFLHPRGAGEGEERVTTYTERGRGGRRGRAYRLRNTRRRQREEVLHPRWRGVAPHAYRDGTAYPLPSQQRSHLHSEEILKRVWSDEVVVLDRTIDVNITRLRKKIGRYGNYIVTRLGYGYGFDV
jgi:two-component system alkaline phosphatase synthesis response regulator PhoP